VFALTGDDRPAADLTALAELLSCRQVNPAGVVRGLGAAGFEAAWADGRARFAAEWAAAPVEGLDWHRRVETTAPRTPSGPTTFLNVRLIPERAGQHLWHLDRLIAAEPNDLGHFHARARAHAARGEFPAAAADYDRALDRGLALGLTPGATVYRMRATVRAELGDWKGAEEDLAASRAQPPDLPFPGPTAANAANAVRVPLALVRLRRGNEEGYRAVCAELAAATRGAPAAGGGLTINSVASYWPVLLRDGADPGQQDLYPAAADLIRAAASGLAARLANPIGLGPALRYRQGRYAEAEEQFGQQAATACDYFFLAMAQHRQGNPEAAKSLANGIELQGQSRATPAIDATGIGVTPFASGWQVRVAEDELRKEAEGLIGKK
jgi:tetratricopeptide (TPR) repeat protein